MKTRTVSQEEMRSRIARWSERRVSKNHKADPSIPAEAFEELAIPLHVLLAHAPEGSDPDSLPPVVGAKGMFMAILEIQPGRKGPMHVHLRSREIFICLKGRVKFLWNEAADEEAILEPFDLIDVPLGVYRDFQGMGDEPALLLAIIMDEREDEPGDVVIAPEVRARFAARFGEEILPKLTAATGLHFTDPPALTEQKESP